MRTSLFREAARQNTQAKSFGEILLVRPISFTLLALVAAAMTLVLVCFIAVGSYTKRVTVSGQLAPNLGVLKIYASQPGIVFSKHVREGRSVKKGERLFVLSAERQSREGKEIQASISEHVALKLQSLRDELVQTQRLQSAQENVLDKKIKALIEEKASAMSQISGQRSRIKLATASVDRAVKLLSQGFFSADMAQQKQADLLDQRNRLEALERERLGIERELHAAQSELSGLPVFHRNQLAQLERLLANTTQEWTESEGKRELAITAPQDGVVTSITADVGQSVDIAKPILSIIPKGAVLEAQLFAPSRAIGFIRPGHHVLLRYHAYPYQKFGHALGTVTSISQSSMSGHELTSAQVPGEALYRITVTLKQQTVRAYGQAYSLQAGMMVDADILQEKRKLYEWVLEPLFSLTGKL